MDFQPPADAQELLSTVRRFVREKIDSRWKEIEERDEVPADLLQAAADLGLFGISIPEEYGGLGLSMLSRAMLYEELGRTHAGFTSIIGTHCGIGTSVIVGAGSERLKQRYLPDLASGRVIGAFALTEPEAGSDAASLRLKATCDGDHYVLSGTKHFITNSQLAGIFTVFARTNATPGGKGISAFVVERGTPGMDVGRPQVTMGLRGSHVAELHFDGCRVPTENMIGAEGAGYRAALRTLAQGRVGISARCVGAATRVTEMARDYALIREQFGQRIIDFQMIQGYLADMAADTAAARYLAYYAAWLVDQGQPCRQESAMAKLIATESYGRTVDKALQIHGGLGYIRDAEIEHFYRDARITRIYEGTSEVQKMIIAREMIESAGK